MQDLFQGSKAEFSHCRKYRYRLYRQWDARLPTLAFIMLNPSTADEFKNDPTVERCQRRAVKMGFGRLEIGNLFAYRSTDRSVLSKIDDPVGPDNDQALAAIAKLSDMVVCGWGNDGLLNNRCVDALRILVGAGATPMALEVNKATGQPRHPLYVGYDKQPYQLPL